MRGRVVKVEGCPCGARLRWGDANVGQGRWGGGMPTQGRIVKVEGDACGAGSLRWRGAEVGQGHAVEGRPGRPVTGGTEGPGWGSAEKKKKGDLGGTGIWGRGSQEEWWGKMEGCPQGRGPHRAVWRGGGVGVPGGGEVVGVAGW